MHTSFRIAVVILLSMLAFALSGCCQTQKSPIHVTLDDSLKNSAVDVHLVAVDQAGESGGFALLKDKKTSDLSSSQIRDNKVIKKKTLAFGPGHDQTQKFDVKDPEWASLWNSWGAGASQMLIVTDLPNVPPEGRNKLVSLKSCDHKDLPGGIWSIVLTSNGIIGPVPVKK